MSVETAPNRKVNKMTDERINEHTFSEECDQLAQDIFDEMLAEMEDDETPDHYTDDMSDRAHETADGHQWVIYYHYAHNICAACNTDNGEAFLEEVGCSEPTYDKLATFIAYGEMRARIDSRIQELVSKWEPAEEGEATA